ncbi:MAG: hypothetical protein ACQGVK_13630 [Myxococcota bacterium]
MSSRPWCGSIPPSPPRAETRRSAVRGARTAAALAAVVALAGLVGCSSFRSQLPLPPPGESALAGDLGVAGVLTRPPEGAPDAGVYAASPEEGAALAEAVGRPLARPTLDTPALRLLLQPPAALAASGHALAEVRQQLGHRYAAVAARDAIELRHRTTWDVIIVIPTPWIIFWWNWPIPMSSPKTVPHDTAVVRIVDLDGARIVGESFLLRRGKARGKPFKKSQLSDALEELGWKGQ